MKPGNLLIQGAKSVGKTRDEDSIERTSGPSVCGFYFFRREIPNPNRFSVPCISQYRRKSLDNTQSIVCRIFFVLENAEN